MASSDVAPLPVGIILYGYRIDKVLGQGGFGLTYLGTKLETGQVCVIKENIPGVSARRAPGEIKFSWVDNAEHAEGTGSPKWAEDNFIREAMRLTQLRHRGIVTATEAFRSRETGTAYYTMPYVSPDSLSHVLRQDISCTKEWVLYLLAALLDSLKYVHSRNVLHRDVKPENILLAPDGEPVLIDFGSARAAETDHKTRIVSANYSPIEQIIGEGEGPWTDLYSLAAGIYQVITGEYVPQPARRGGKKDAYVPLASRPAMVAKYGMPLLSSLDKALAYEPEDRYQSAEEWMAVLRAEPGFQFHTPVPPPVRRAPALPVAPTVLLGDNIKLPRKKRGTGRIAALIVAILLLLGAAAAAWWWCMCREVPPPPVELPPLPPPPVEEPKPAASELRVIARPDIRMYDADGNPLKDVDVPAFAVYYSRGETANGCYEVAELPGPDSETVGFLKRDEVYPWPLNLVIDFRSQGGVTKRDRALFFKDSDHAKAFITDMNRDGRHELTKRAAAAAGGISDSDWAESAGVVAIEPRQKGDNPRLLPVLDFMKRADGMEEFAYTGADGGASASVLQIAAMTAHNVQVEVPDKQKPAPDVDLVFVVDTTRSMGPYIDAVREFIASQAEMLDTASRGRIRFGLVAYRDWKKGRDGMPDTTFCGYLTKNYTREVGHMMNSDEFKREVLEKRNGNGEYDLCETRVDSVDCAEDVFSGLYEAVVNTPWRDKNAQSSEDHNLRFVMLIGDAPCRARGERETNALCLGSEFWKQRATGSLCDLYKDSIVDLMKDKGNHVFLMSYFVVTPRPNGTKEKDWNKYLKSGIAQFRSLSYSDPGGDQSKCCTVVQGIQFQESDGTAKKNILEKLNVETKTNFQKSIEDSISELAKLSGSMDRGEEMAEDAEASAAKTLFAGAYVEWFSKQKPNEDDKADMMGWTQDKNDNSTDTMVAKVVLSRAQLEQAVQKIQRVIDDINAREGEDLDEAIDGVVAQMYTLVSDPNIARAKLGGDAKSRISALPFKSNLLQQVANSALDDASAKEELLDKLKEKVKFMQTCLSNKGSCIQDPRGMPEHDLFLIPVNMLP